MVSHQSFRCGLVAALVFLAALPGIASAALFARQSSDLQHEAKAAAREGKQLAVFMTLPDCPACQEMARTVHVDRTVEPGFARHFRSVEIDISASRTLIDPSGKTTTATDFARQLRAVATPSYAFFDAAGQVLYRHTGALDAYGFRKLAAHVVKGRYEHQPFVVPPAHPLKLHADTPGATLTRYPDFSLSATDGKTYRPSDFHGRAIALAVGYTQCPDVCPTTLVELQSAVEALPKRLRQNVQVLFVTLDPERDTLAVLREYTQAFQPQGGRPMLGLRGDSRQTAALIQQLQLVAEKQPSASMGYTLDHTAGVFLFAGDGQLLALSPYGQPLPLLRSDLARIAALPNRFPKKISSK